VQLRLFAGVVANIAKAADAIRSGRPPEETPDEATSRIVAVRDRAVERMVGDVDARLASWEQWKAETILAHRTAHGDAAAEDLTARLATIGGG
jgi:hypothetical protein